MPPLSELMLPGVFVVAFAAFLFWTWRQNEFFHLSVRKGRVLIVRGRIPSALLSDIKDVVQRVASGSIRVQKTSSGGRLVALGVDSDTQQKLRNLFGLYTQSQLRSAKPLHRPTIGQRLGIASLAWWQERHK